MTFFIYFPMKLQPSRRFERTTWFTQLRHSGILLPNNLTVVQLAQTRHLPARRCICMARHYNFELLSRCCPLVTVMIIVEFPGMRVYLVFIPKLTNIASSLPNLISSAYADSTLEKYRPAWKKRIRRPNQFLTKGKGVQLFKLTWV